MIFKANEKIVFAGDSITDDGRQPAGEGLWGELGNGYVKLIDSFFTAEMPEMNLRIVNRGNSGNASRDLLARWDTDITAIDPDWVVLLIGANDIWRQFDSPTRPEASVSPEEYRKNLNAIADKTKANMIWMTPYFLEPNEKDLMRARTDEYRAIFREVAKERGFLCIDLQEAFARYLSVRHSCSITWDRVHPGRIGSVIIARAFFKAVGFRLD